MGTNSLKYIYIAVFCDITVRPMSMEVQGKEKSAYQEKKDIAWCLCKPQLH
jgi:hypothetical protein